MKLNQNKKDEILNLDSCSKNLLIWIQLQALQEDKIECSYSLYSKETKVSLNTFKKALGGLLDSRILYATSLKGWYSLNEEFVDFVKTKKIPFYRLKELEQTIMEEEYSTSNLVKLKPEILERLKTESVEDIKKDLLK